MDYVNYYLSPIGKLVLASNENFLKGLWFENQKYFLNGLGKDFVEKETLVLKKTKLWLDIYFSAKNPDFMPEIELVGTNFQKQVWQILKTIPYGKTLSYKEIANQISKKMSAQAVAGAISKNKISIIIPCHRVIGFDKSLVGYAAGLEKKKKLLELEGNKIKNLKIL